MPFNGSNTFSIVNTFVPGTTILSSAVNANFTDIATGLSDCVTRDAQGAVTGNLLFSSTGYMQLPAGTTGQRPGTALAAYFRYNTTTGAPEFYDGTNWDSLAATVSVPQGYLTLTSGTPVITSDVTAATSVYYTPYNGQLCPIYNGTNFINQVFSEQTLTLVSNHLASTIYDVFAFLNSGTFTIGTGPAWSSSAAGSGSRGTGAGTTQLQRLNGIWTNQVSITARNGSSTYTVSANQGTYLGSIFIDGSAGQVSCYRSWGQNRKFGVWNAYNRKTIMMQAGDTTASWTPATTYPTFAASNANSANKITTFTGLAEEEISCFFQITGNNTAAARVMYVGIGVNSTTTASGTVGELDGVSSQTVGVITAQTIVQPGIGINNIQSLDAGAGASTTMNGTQAFMTLTTSYQG